MRQSETDVKSHGASGIHILRIAQRKTSCYLDRVEDQLVHQPYRRRCAVGSACNRLRIQSAKKPSCG